MRPALYYALGGGLGHITRARALLAQLGAQARILTRAEHAADPRLSRGLNLLPVPDGLEPAALGPWIQALLHRERPQVLFLDSFPAGLFGEFCGMRLPPDLRLEHVARLLRWDVYSAVLQGESPRLHRVHILEDLAPAHAAWLRRHAGQVSRLALRDPPMPAADPGARKRFEALPRPRWLVVHAGPPAEIRELLDYAREQALAEGGAPSLCLVSPDTGEDPAGEVLRLDCYPAAPLFPLADRIISACGFNIMRQTLPFRERHRFLPMPRRFDDQFARAAARRACLERADIP